jgi:hypothetical protein
MTTETERAADDLTLLRQALDALVHMQRAAAEMHCGLKICDDTIDALLQRLQDAAGAAPTPEWIASTTDVFDQEAVQSVLTGRSTDEIKADIAGLRQRLQEMVAVLREYGTFPPKVLPALQAAERALGVAAPAPASKPPAGAAPTEGGQAE